MNSDKWNAIIALFVLIGISVVFAVAMGWWFMAVYIAVMGIVISLATDDGGSDPFQ